MDRGMRRFFVEKITARDGRFTITGSEARHITKVLRMRPGEQFILMEGKGSRFLVTIESAGRHEVRVSIEKNLPKPPPSPVEIFLCQALLKSGPMDYLIQKTSELGVNHILPFSCSRSITRLKRDRSDNKMRHWREIARNSSKQSGRIAPAQIESPLSFAEMVEKGRKYDASKAILWEEEGVQDLKGLLRGPSRSRRFVGIVGPEGGFAREEIESAEDAGFIPVSLGNRILRAETAAIAMVAIVQYEWGDLRDSSGTTIVGPHSGTEALI